MALLDGRSGDMSICTCGCLALAAVVSLCWISRTLWLLSLMLAALDLAVHVAGVETSKTARPLPNACAHSSTVVTCSTADGATLRDLKQALLMEVVVDFVLLETSGKTCTCPLVQLVESLKETDIVVLSRALCGLDDYKSCGHEVPEPPKVIVAGLVISPADSKLKWAIRHHVLRLWNKVKAVKKSPQRNLIFRAVIKAVRRSAAMLGEAALKNGQVHLMFGELPPSSPAEPLIEEAHSVDSNLKAQLWEAEENKHEKAAAIFSEGVQAAMGLLSGFDALIGGETAEGVVSDAERLNKGDQVKEVNEAVMEADLADQLTQIKQDLKNKGKRKRKRDAAASVHLNYDYRRSTPKRGNYFFKNQNRYRLQTRRRRSKDKTENVNILPYKIFVGGDYTSVFDTVAIDLALSMEANLPKHKVKVVPDAQAIMAAPLPASIASGGSATIPLASQDSRRFGADAVQLALLAEASADSLMDDLTEDDVIDELRNVGEDNRRLEEEEEEDQRVLSNMLDSQGDTGVVLSGNASLLLPPVVAGPVALAAAAAPAPRTKADTLKDDRRHAREQDHIFKNFIVFIVAIIGIIIIFAVLIIMGMKRRPSLEDMELFQKHRQMQMLEHEQRAAQRMDIRHHYDGVTPPASPFAAFHGQAPPGILRGSGGQGRQTPRPVKELRYGHDVLLPSDWAPPMTMEPPLLGGRHVVTEFEDEPQPVTRVSEKSRSPTWPYFLQPTYWSRVTSPPRARPDARDAGRSASYFQADLNNSKAYYNNDKNNNNKASPATL